MGKNKHLRKSTSFVQNNLNTSGDVNKNKNNRRSFASVTNKTNEREQLNPNDKLFETLMNDPIKRAVVLQILSQEKNLIEEYKRKEADKKTPLRKIKKTYTYESPTTLFRRKQLQRREENKDGSETSSNCSESSENTTNSPPTVPYNRLLKGLVIYVEIRCKGEDKSAVAKLLIKGMGGTTRDEFTKDVTHVIFKDGSYDTYQRAKLAKVFLVSVLWLEAVRKNRCIVPEGEYPAFNISKSIGDMSLICEKMQKEYDEILNEEYNRSRFDRSLKKSQSHRKISSTTKRSIDFQTDSRLQNGDDSPDTSSVVASDDSNCGIINGSTFKNRSRKNNGDDSPKCANSNVRESTNSTPSFSLVSMKILEKNKTNCEETEMDMTSNIAGNVTNNSITTANKRNAIASKPCRTPRKSTINEGTRVSDTSRHSTDVSTNISNNTRNSKSGDNSLQKNNTKGSTKSSLVSNADELPSLRLSTTTSANISSNRNSRNSEMPPLRLSSDTSTNMPDQKQNDSLKEILSDTANKKKSETKRRNTTNTECTPEKLIKIVNNDGFVTTRKTKKATNKIIESATKSTGKRRRLFNLDDSFCINHSDENVPKEPVPTVLLTPSAKKYLEKKKTKNADTNKTKSQKLEINATPKRKSLRISRIQENKHDDDYSDVTITPINRRSTLDFVQSVKNKKRTPQSKTSPTIVCTRLHNADVQVFEQIVKKLGNFVVEDEVSVKTTHLVAGECKRTINILRAIARGCWILKHEWLLKSLENGKWLPEDDYELTEFSPAVQKCRKERQAFGDSYSSDVFLNCGYIYVCKSSTPRCSDLKELVQMCNGKITTILRNACIVVGEHIEREDVVCVKETWILDSITFNKKKSFKNYLLKR